MADFWNPQSELLREPNLLIPGKKPVGAVRVDQSHELGRKCTGCWLFDGTFIDKTTGKKINNLCGSKTLPAIIIDGVEGGVADIDNGGDTASIPISELYSGGPYTIAIRANPNEKAGISHMVGVDGNSSNGEKLLRVYWGSDGLMDAVFAIVGGGTSITSDVTVGGYKTWSFSNTEAVGRNEILVYENGVNKLDTTGSISPKLYEKGTTPNIRSSLSPPK